MGARKILSKDLPDIFRKVYMEGRSMTEVAEIYNVAHSTISSNLQEYKIGAYKEYVKKFNRDINKMMLNTNSLRYQVDKITLYNLLKAGQEYFPEDMNKEITM